MLLDGNPITSLPEDFTNLKELERLDIRAMKLETLPKMLLQLPKLKVKVVQQFPNSDSQSIGVAGNPYPKIPGEVTTEWQRLEHGKKLEELFISVTQFLKTVQD